MHDIENGLQSLQAQFRIAETINEAGRIADIRKQNGKSFALTTFCMKRPEDMLPGLIGCPSGCRLQRSAALTAEAAGWSVKMTTCAALNSQGCPTSLAILIGYLVLATATQTLHRWPLKYSGSETASKANYNPYTINSMPVHFLARTHLACQQSLKKRRLSGMSGCNHIVLLANGTTSRSAIILLGSGGIPRK